MVAWQRVAASGIGGLVLLALGLNTLARHADGCGAYGAYLGGIWPNEGGPNEWLWTLLHHLGMRDIFTTARCLHPLYWTSYLTFEPRIHLFAPRSAGGRRRWALTIDDAVRRYETDDYSSYEALLDVLDEQGTKATFFVIANNATKSIEGRRLLKLTVARGHALGNHGVWDTSMYKDSREKFEASIQAWEDLMMDIVGEPAAWQRDGWKWFRPPKGHLSRVMLDVLVARGYTLSFADTFSEDWGIVDPLFHARLMANSVCDGSVAVMHAPDLSWGAQIVDTLPIALPAMRDRGFEPVLLTDLFAEALEAGRWRTLLSLSYLAVLLLLATAVVSVVPGGLGWCFFEGARAWRRRSYKRVPTQGPAAVLGKPAAAADALPASETHCGRKAFKVEPECC